MMDEPPPLSLPLLTSSKNSFATMHARVAAPFNKKGGTTQSHHFKISLAKPIMPMLITSQKPQLHCHPQHSPSLNLHFSPSIPLMMRPYSKHADAPLRYRSAPCLQGPRGSFLPFLPSLMTSGHELIVTSDTPRPNNLIVISSLPPLILTPSLIDSMSILFTVTPIFQVSITGTDPGEHSHPPDPSPDAKATKSCHQPLFDAPNSIPQPATS